VDNPTESFGTPKLFLSSESDEPGVDDLYKRSPDKCVGFPALNVTEFPDGSTDCFPMYIPGSTDYIYATVECGVKVYSCFPSAGSVTRADGRTARLDELRVGDELIAMTSSGSRTTDTVSVFSLADSATTATFVSLDISNGARLLVTPDHHLPTGAVCCAELARAKTFREGSPIWVAGASGALEQHTVASVSLEIAEGLHNPLLTRGSMPVVDGTVTSFNRIETVRIDGLVLPWVEAACMLTGSCTALRRVVTGFECAYSHLINFSWSGAASAAPLCKTFHYIDGVTCHAGSCWATPSAAAPAPAEAPAHPAHCGSHAA